MDAKRPHRRLYPLLVIVHGWPREGLNPLARKTNLSGLGLFLNRISYFAQIGLLVLALSGCARLSALADGNASPTWQIGIVGAALGPGGVEGSYSANGAQLAMNAINAHGGIAWGGQHFQLAPTYSGANAVVDRVRDFTSRAIPPVALLGPDESDPAVAALPMFTSARIPTFTLALADGLTAPSAQTAPASLWRVRPPLAAWARALATYAAGHPDGPLALATIDNDYGHAGTTTILSTLAAASTTPAAQVTLAPGLSDPSAQVAQIMAAHATTLLCWSTEAEAATLLHALRAAGWQGQFLLGQIDADFIALAGSDGDAVLGLTTWSPAFTDAASQHFVAAYTRRFGTQPDDHAAAMYDAVNMLAGGLAAVGPDHTSLAHYLATLSGFQGVTGLYDATHASQQFHTLGDLTTTLHLVQIQQGIVTDAATIG